MRPPSTAQDDIANESKPRRSLLRDQVNLCCQYGRFPKLGCVSSFPGLFAGAPQPFDQTRLLLVSETVRKQEELQSASHTGARAQAAPLSSLPVLLCSHGRSAESCVRSRQAGSQLQVEHPGAVYPPIRQCRRLSPQPYPKGHRAQEELATEECFVPELQINVSHCRSIDGTHS